MTSSAQPPGLRAAAGDLRRAARALHALRAAACGWGAALLLTLFLEIPELWANAAPSSRGMLVLAGCGLWAAFTLLVCAVVWCLLVLPLALLVPPAAMVRYRRVVRVGAPLLGVWFLGWRLGTWSDLRHQNAENPLASLLFWNYAVFAMVFALVTAWVYTRRLRQAVR